ncbi:MAG: GNAT family N-acetyltransferase, partial [Angustibacter sp.]
LTEKIDRWGAASQWLGGRFVGYFRDDALTAACWVGTNIMPIGAPGPEAQRAFAEQIDRGKRHYSSLYGAAPAVAGLWRQLGDLGWRAREERLIQPLFRMTAPGPIRPDPRVRLARPDEVDEVFPASVAMFQEEVGYSPITQDGSYLRRVQALIDQGRTFIRVDDRGRVVFKADVGARSDRVSQIHGVWLTPELRGRGMSAAAMSAVVAGALRSTPAVSLYVNNFNSTALALYRRVGFVRIGTCATVRL